MEKLNNTFSESAINSDDEFLESNLGDLSFGNISGISDIDLENIYFDKDVSLDEVMNNNSPKIRGEKRKLNDPDI